MTIKNNKSVQTLPNYARKIIKATEFACYQNMLQWMIGNYLILPFETLQVINEFNLDYEHLKINTIHNYHSDIEEFFEECQDQMDSLK